MFILAFFLFLKSGLNHFKCVELDFSDPHETSEYQEILRSNLPSSEELANCYSQLICVYNHGSLEFGNIQEMARGLVKKFETNLFSVWSLLAAVNLIMPVGLISEQFHVNISSGYAVRAEPYWAGHCCSKCLCSENKQNFFLINCILFVKLECHVICYSSVWLSRIPVFEY